MPELPEVETVVRGLNKLIVGKTISSIESDWAKSFPNNDKQVATKLITASIESVERRGKGIIINLNSGYSLLIHLKMTGQLVFRGEEDFGAGHPTDSLVSKLPDRSTRVIFEFEDTTTLFFNDQRKFGWVKLIKTAELKNDSFLAKLGPEPLSKSTTQDDFIERIKRRPGTTIKAAILDQSVIAGVGNIYADEALFLAGIRPEKRVKTITRAKLELLFAAIKQVLQEGIDAGGSTDKNYVNAEGKKGSYLSFARVFRREGRDCVQCGSTIIKNRVAGRGTHYCKVCQKR